MAAEEAGALTGTVKRKKLPLCPAFIFHSPHTCSTVSHIDKSRLLHFQKQKLQPRLSTIKKNGGRTVSGHTMSPFLFLAFFFGTILGGCWETFLFSSTAWGRHRRTRCCFKRCSCSQQDVYQSKTAACITHTKPLHKKCKNLQITWTGAQPDGAHVWFKLTAAISIRRSEVGALDFNEMAGRISLHVHLRLNSAAEESMWKLAVWGFAHFFFHCYFTEEELIKKGVRLMF